MRRTSQDNLTRSMLTRTAGKSLEQIDEIFGDIQKRDVEFYLDEKEVFRKEGSKVSEAEK